MERKLQSKIIKWLKDQGAYVIKTRPQPGVPVGCMDIIALYREKWATIEVKALPTSPYQPGQEATIAWLGKWNKNVYVAHTENWEEVKAQLLSHFF